MTTATFPIDDVATVPASRTGVGPRRETRRGAAVGPVARPRPGVRLAPMPAQRGARACRAEARAVAAPRPAVATSAWRLTERGVAVVLVVATMIAVAAVAVIGLTALRVTSSDYVPAGSSQLSR